MADSSVPITPGTGTTIDTRTTPGGEHRQVMTLGNDGDRVAGVMPWGALETFTGLATLFYDSWSTAIDTVDKWTVTGTTPSVSGGNMTFATTAGYHAIRTKDTIRPNAGFTLVRNGIWLEAAAGTGSSRFWGLATPATTPSATVMAQDGAGFEVDQAGALSAVVYSGGAKTHTFALTRPTDGAVHAYEVQFRVTGVTWHIDGFQVPVAAQSFPTIAVVELPALLARFNVGTPAGVTYTNIAHLTGDTSRQGMTLMDPVIGTRQARVTPAGGVVIAQSSDQGRVNVTLNFNAVGATADSLLTMAVNKGAATSSVTTVPVTAGKIFRVMGVSYGVRAGAGTVPSGTMTLRVNYSGAAVIGSPAHIVLAAAGSAAVAGNMGTANLAAGDGLLELSGTAQLAVSNFTNLATTVAVITVFGYEYTA